MSARRRLSPEADGKILRDLYRVSPETGRKIMRDAYRKIESYHRRRRRRHWLYLMFRGLLIWIVFALIVHSFL